MILFLISHICAIEEINLYTWTKYISQTVLNKFEEKYNVKVNYITFPSSDIGVQNIRNNKSRYDIVIMSRNPDYAHIKDLILKIDKNRLSKDIKIIDDNIIPYIYGSTGILYNETLVKKYINDWSRDSWDIFFDKKFARRIQNKFALLDDKCDVFASYIQYLKYYHLIENNNVNKHNVAKALYHLSDIKKYMNKFTTGLCINNLVAIQTYSSYGKMNMTLNKDLQYIEPKEGSELWTDVIMILNDKKKHIYDLINHILSHEMMNITFSELNLSQIKIKDNLNQIHYQNDDNYDIELMWMEFLSGDIKLTQYIPMIILCITVYFLYYIKRKNEK